MKLIKLIFLFICPAIAYGNQDYECVITNAVVPKANGALEAIGDISIINKKFTVDRISGVMTGVLKNNYVTEPKVIDNGSKKNSFKVVTIMNNKTTSNIHMLIIQEYTASNKKPFTYVHNETIFHGVCNHF